MELAQDKIDLIEKIIRSDRKFVNNEDLYDDFFNETCKRSFLIVKTVSSEITLEAYLKKIATTSILNVLKNEGRLRRAKSGYMSVKEVPLETSTSDAVDYSKIHIAYEPVAIQDTPEDIVIKKDILQTIVDSVCEIDEINPEKKYFQLYHMRYEKGLTQQEISAELGISQGEVCKRLFKLMDEVKKSFNLDY